MTKDTLHCPKCGSEDIAIFTCSYWDKKNQSMRIDGILHIHCGNCDDLYWDYETKTEAS